ncbi:hypothetical protein Droror1_Dr00016728 [Drosera rotundifolia]
MDLLIYFCFCFLIVVPVLVTAKTQTNITLGLSLTAGENSSWASPSGDFAVGFQSVGAAGDFLIAIWFNKIPEKTILWSANSNQRAKSGSKLELTTHGVFVLNDPAGNKIWGPDATGVAYAAMLDTGNLVLATTAGLTVWQSFDSPTDTILPTQNLNEGDTIIASYSESNYSSGRFLLAMQNDGNLVLYTLNILGNENAAYWASNTVGSGYRVEFNESGLVFLVAENGTILSQIFSGNSSSEDFYQRVTLDYDGVLRKYVYPRSSSSIAGRWPKAWSILSFEPSNICTNAWTRAVGSGICGFNSVCQLGAADGRPECSCPSGYIWVDSDNQALGCTPTFPIQNCDPALDASNQSALVQMLNTDFPGSDYQHYSGVDEDWCREQCLADCFCAVAIFRTGDCWSKRLPLSYGKTDPSVGGKALVKIGTGNSTVFKNGDTKKRDRSRLVVVGSVLLGSSVFLNILLLILSLVVVFRLSKKSSMAPQQGYQVIPGTNTRIFSYKELEEATDNFREKVGQGAFATVYKGNVGSEIGVVVIAVKKLDKVFKDSDKEFKREVRAIARTNHKNLVQLVGYCNEDQHRLLVYEFMSHGSIADILFLDQKPSWFMRVQIAIGTARGINYLHEECSSQIIHCDIKPQNVLLDDSYTARISDFGLAKLLRADQTRTMTSIRGTKGYVAPEWFRNMPITVKVDVYSFGTLLLELVCCRKCFDVTNVDESQAVLADWAYDCYRQGRVDWLVGEDDDARDDLRRVEKYVMVAIWCIQEEPSLRPSMKKVIQMLEGSVEVAVPPDPSSYISSI